MARILDAHGMSEVLRILGETEYSSAIENSTPDDYEAVLAREFERVLGFVSEFVPDPTVVDMFRIRHDLHNCKVAFRAYALKDDVQDLWSHLGTAPAAEVRQAVAREIGLNGLPAHLKTLVTVGFDHLGLEVVDSVLEDDSGSHQLDIKSFDPQTLDMALDRACFATLREMARQIGSSLISQLVRVRVDLANMTGFLRCTRSRRSLAFFRLAYVPLGDLPFELFEESYEESVEGFIRRMNLSAYDSLINEWSSFAQSKDAVTALERLGRRHLVELSRASRMMFFGPEPVVSYLLAKEIEISDLRAIMVGKSNGLDVESIRERLSGTYA